MAKQARQQSRSTRASQKSAKAILAAPVQKTLVEPADLSADLLSLIESADPKGIVIMGGGNNFAKA